MTQVQKVYRELRRHISATEARHAAPRLLSLGEKWLVSKREASA